MLTINLYLKFMIIPVFLYLLYVPLHLLLALNLLISFNSIRRLKEEVLDPGYNNGHIGTPIGIPIGTPVGSSMMPLAPTHVPPATTNGTPPADKPKRSYTRKPSAGPKAKKVKTEPAVPDPNAPPNGTAQSQIGDHMPVQKKKRDRFKGNCTLVYISEISLKLTALLCTFRMVLRLRQKLLGLSFSEPS